MRQLTFGTLSGLDLFQPPLSRLGYLHSPGTEDEIKPITHWIIGDLATKERRVGLQRCSQSCCPRTPSAQLCMMQGVQHAKLHCAAPGITLQTQSSLAANLQLDPLGWYASSVRSLQAIL